MSAMEEIKRELEAHLEWLKEEYHVGSLGVFGSYVHGEQTKKSDVDILVEFERPIGLFKFLELEEYLGKILKRKVDLVSKKALKPRIGKHILAETIYI
jgi:predicted nucleotidyltransferase